MTDKSVADLSTTRRPLYHHQDLLAAAASTIHWPMIDEHFGIQCLLHYRHDRAPEGRYYSHRSIYLHSTAMVANLRMTLDDCTMILTTPIYHGQGCRRFLMPGSRR